MIAQVGVSTHRAPWHLPEALLRRVALRSSDAWWPLVPSGTLVVSLLLVGTAAPLSSRAERQDLGLWLRLFQPFDTGHPALVVVFLILLSALWAVVRPLRACAPAVQQGRLRLPGTGTAGAARPRPVPDAGAGAGRHAAAVLATDPEWRRTLTPYGPLGLRVEQATAVLSGGHELRALVLLRAVAVVAVAATCWVVSRLVRPVPLGLWLVLSPLVLVHEVGGAHLDAVVCALLAVSLLLHRRGSGLGAVAVSVVAADVKASAGVLLVALVVAAAPRGRAMAVAVVTQLAVCATYPRDPFGWLRALRVAAGSLSPGTLLVRQAGHRLLHLSARTQERAAVTTHHVLVVLGVVAAVGLLLTRHRRDTPATAALLLLTTLLCGPAL